LRFPCAQPTSLFFAAASLSEALKEIAQTYEPASGDKLSFNLGASSTLALQIKQGAPPTCFLRRRSEDERTRQSWPDHRDTRRSLLSNTLVIVVNAENGADIAVPADLAKPAVGRVALAEPQTVPAGIYAKEYLKKSGPMEKINR